MITVFISLFLFGLAIILLSDFIGSILFKFKKSNQFLQFFLGYLILIASYAVVKGGGNSVGIFVLLWIFGYFYLIKSPKDYALIEKKEYLQRLLIISFLWTMIFALKASCFWNFDYNAPNLLFIDNEFYMKVAEGYNMSGNENAMGLKNGLFSFLNFAQPYRTNDFWLVSLGLDITNIDTIYIWELFYSTIIIFICSLSLFTVLRKKFNLWGSLILSVLLLFAFSGQWYRSLINLLYSHNIGSYDPIGIIAYTKLAIVFSILFQFFLKYEKQKKVEAVYLLILIPILVQSTIAFFVIIPLFIGFFIFQKGNYDINKLKEYLPVIVFFIIVVFGIFIFYFFNQQKEQRYMGYSNLNISSNENVLAFVVQFLKKSTLMFISYFWLSFLLVILLLFITKSLDKVFRIELFVFVLICYFSSTLVYAKYNKIGDAYQFSTNVFGPFVLSLIIYLFLQTPINSILGKFKIFILILISLIGMKQIIGGNNVFHSTTRINYYDKAFIDKTKKILSGLNYPLGIIYYGEDLQNYSKEDFPLFNATFLKLTGRNYDVFNIEADSLKINNSDQSLQKINASIKRNALNIWLHNSNRLSNIKKKRNRKDFYEAYPFSFCISKIGKDSLPDFIQSDIVNTIKDANSKIYFYTLERK